MNPNSKSDKEMICAASDRVVEMFFKAYNKYKKDDEHWSITLDNYIYSECNKLDDSTNDLESYFNLEEESDIVMETNKKIFQKLDVSLDEYDKYEGEIDWNSFEELLSYYMCFIVL